VAAATCGAGEMAGARGTDGRFGRPLAGETAWKNGTASTVGCWMRFFTVIICVLQAQGRQKLLRLALASFAPFLPRHLT
jgi:hypothetical protein